ncbi:MAG TPA: DNA topoisomerase IB [Candidatus Thalassarchaeaceae archaeon]|nr:DNA topoisomerase IB [Candidatus Thalassarchaeaceae archaeon]
MKTEDSGASAKGAGLELSDREKPGITRKKIEIPAEKKGDKPTFSWDYFQPNGKKLTDKDRVEFLNSLAVPPAWTDVWFCSNENGHIQATGKDSNGRLQYRYHPKWIEYKSKLKYANIDEFAAELDSLRDLVKEDLAKKEMSKNKVAALVVWLIDRYHIRVGSDQYAQENESYGLTTLKESHISYKKGEKAIVEGMRVLKDSNKPLPKINAMMKFTGKSGKDWKIYIRHPEISKLIEDSAKIGGKDKEQDLFRYVDENGNDFDIKAEHINEYLNQKMENKYTAKDFRTWAASWKTGARLAMVSEASEKEISELPELHQEAVEKSEKDGFPPYVEWCGRYLKGTEGLAKLAESGNLPGETDKERMATMLAVIDTVAADLGNTRAVCRSSYIRPMFMEDWEERVFLDRWKEAKKGQIRGENMWPDETAAINYMKKWED